MTNPPRLDSLPGKKPAFKPAQLRERLDPDEKQRPLPWFMVMLIGAMAMWGAFYIYATPSGIESAYGDQRTVSTLRPPEKLAAGAAPTVDGKQLFGAKCAACHQASGLGVSRSAATFLAATVEGQVGRCGGPTDRIAVLHDDQTSVLYETAPGCPLMSQAKMDEWIDYYDSTHTIYASKLHRDVHFEVIASDIIGYISSPDAVVLDYACGEALSAAKVAAACGRLILAEPAPGVRGRLIARFAPITKIRVRSLDELRDMEESSIDLAVMNSVAQYMTPAELEDAFKVIHRLLKPTGRLVLGDILQPDVGMGRD
eukprot:gene5912-8005_t